MSNKAGVGLKDKAEAKGYTKDDLGERWGIKERQMFNIMREPKQIHLDAVAGLPRKKRRAV